MTDDHMTIMNAVKRERETEDRIRNLDYYEIVEEIHEKEDLIDDMLEALEYVMEDDNLVPRASSECRKVVAAAIAKARS